MKTADEIKKGLETCSADECHGQHTDCPYHPDLMCIRNICADALALIKQLEAELSDAKNNHQHTIDIAERMKSQIEKLKKVIVRLNTERDAAVKSLRGRCFECKHNKTSVCLICSKDKELKYWQWRGVQKEDAHEQ